MQFRISISPTTTRLCVAKSVENIFQKRFLISKYLQTWKEQVSLCVCMSACVYESLTNKSVVFFDIEDHIALDKNSGPECNTLLHGDIYGACLHRQFHYPAFYTTWLHFHTPISTKYYFVYHNYTC